MVKRHACKAGELHSFKFWNPIRHWISCKHVIIMCPPEQATLYIRRLAALVGVPGVKLRKLFE
jgi:hypothetical protein